MTASPTFPPAPPAPARKLSLASLFSLIFGILGCIPFIGGALAVLLGIIGFVRTANPMRWGRWMAIVGLILGIMSLAGWTLFGGAAYAMWKGTEGPRIAAAMISSVTPRQKITRPRLPNHRHVQGRLRRPCRATSRHRADEGQIRRYDVFFHQHRQRFRRG